MVVGRQDSLNWGGGALGAVVVRAHCSPSPLLDWGTRF